jgi:amino acid adenylation domain-containing protein
VAKATTTNFYLFDERVNPMTLHTDNSTMELSASERHKILVEWNNTQADYPKDKCIHQLFEAQVERTPKAIAVVFEDQQLTYEELNRRANQLAHHLQSLGVSPEVLVGICVERSLEMVVGLLAILKAGGAYVPLSPNYPKERLAFMLADAGVPVLLTQEKLKEELPEHQAQVVCLETDWGSFSERNPVSEVSSKNLAYVIYTSGSTGNPKGVQISHLSLLNFLISMQKQPGLTSDDVLLAITTVSFDIAALEIYLPLIVGAKIVLASRVEATEGLRLLEKLKHDGITVMQATPATWHLLLTTGWESTRKLKILCGGEALPRELAMQLLEKGQTLWNLYGPTETTIWSTMAQVLATTSSVVSIGQPIANTQIYILDQHLQPVSIEVLGELHLGGVGLARGYLNRPDLTAEKFLPNPFSEEPGSRLYKTGDLARYLPDGQIEYLGRIDNQVKIRGFRIELGEIEAVLVQHPDVQEAVVLAREDEPGEPRLVAYVVSDLIPTRIPYQAECLVKYEDQTVPLQTADICTAGALLEGRMSFEKGKEISLHVQLPGESKPCWLKGRVAYSRASTAGIDFKLTPDEQVMMANGVRYELENKGFLEFLHYSLRDKLRNALSDKLPDYMVPSDFVLLMSLPLTPNGKIDRRALSQLSIKRFQLPDNRFVAPKRSTEALLAGIWASVLGVERVGVHDNFFELGGHSLLISKVISRLQETLKVELPMLSLFDSPTIAELAQHLETSLRQKPNLQQAPAIQPISRQQNLPLSYFQEQLWFLAQLNPNVPVYNESASIHINSTLNVSALENSLNEILKRHEALRTNFVSVSGQPVQMIMRPPTFKLPVVDIRNLPLEQRQVKARQLATEEAKRIFDLTQDILWRAILVRLSEGQYRLFLTLHHIIIDGVSLAIFLTELAVLYKAFFTGQPSPLPELPIQYADFASWQRQHLSAEIVDSQLSYWKTRLGDSLPVLQLLTDHPRPVTPTFRGAKQYLVLSKSLTEALKMLSQQEGVTLFMTLLAAFKTLLSRYTGQDDIVVGTVAAVRNRPELEPLMGYLLNTLVLRTSVSGRPTFQQFLARVRDVTLGAMAHKDLPFEKLVEAVLSSRDIGQNPLFQVAFSLDPSMPEIELGWTLTQSDIDNGTAKFELYLGLEEKPEGLIGRIEYRTDLFDAPTIERMIGHFQTLLEGIVANPLERISELPLLTETERHQLLVDWNDTQTDYPKDKCLHQLFEEQVEQTPNHVAVVFEDQQLTYRELNRKANQLAHYLQTLGVKPEVLVGIGVERSIAMVIGLLGILKAGGAYLPLDPAYPKARLAFMLEEAQVPVLLTQSSLKQKLPETKAQIVCLDVEAKTLSQFAQENVVSGVAPENLAYVIYTSGSTGNPKGVAIEHRNVVALLKWSKTIFTLEPVSGTLVSTSLNFDVSVFELFVPLSRGGKLILVENILSLSRLSETAGVIMVNTVPSAMKELLKIKGIPASVRVINLAGEPFSTQLVQELYQLSSLQQVFNIYGPTEYTVYATFTGLSQSAEKKLTIGRPISNAQTYILAHNLQPVPIGVPGELHLGGAGLARGYLNRPDLTAEKFLNNPFSEEPGSRLYKTGDLARYLSDGNIEYLGRIDNQVKIRGFRIELGEIETRLAQHAEVQEVAVIAREEPLGDKRLVAYFVPNPPTQGPTASSLRHFLKNKLPDYMIPSAFVMLEAMPLTQNGKRDRRALSQREVDSYQLSDKTFVAPRDALELQLAQIWEAVLDVYPVGVQDNFFELGGHSLLAVRLMAEIQQQFAKTLSLATLFQGATLEQLAKIIRQQTTDSQAWSPLVAIQPHGSKRPFFCMPGSGGNVIYFYHLARHLGTERPFYALQARGLDGESAPLSCVEDIAAYYLEAIRTVQPQGPYLLGGHSFGALVAFEMAQQLQQQGQTVALLAILDLPALRPERSPIELDWNEAKWMATIASILESLSGKTLGLCEADFQALDTDAQLERLSVRLEKVKLLPVEAGINYVRRIVQVIKADEIAFLRYVPPADYPNRITLFKTGDVYQDDLGILAEIPDDPAWGWGRLSTEPVEVFRVPGNHTTMLTEPHVPVLAEKLKECLEKI